MIAIITTSLQSYKSSGERFLFIQLISFLLQKHIIKILVIILSIVVISKISL